jgi:hypothetical protein
MKKEKRTRRKPDEILGIMIGKPTSLGESNLFLVCPVV